MQEENLQKNVTDNNTATDDKKQDRFGRLKPLRTYQGDVSDVIGKTKTSVVSIAVAEQNRKTQNSLKNKPEEETDHTTRNKFFALAGVVLFVLGVVVVGVFYYFSLQNEITQTNQNRTILNYDKEVKIPIVGSARNDLIQKITEEKENFNLPVGSILYIDTMDASTTAKIQKVLQILTPQIPPPLLRDLSSSYMFGVYSSNKNQPFIILTIDDYGIGFSEMLKWENTMMKDIGPIFGLVSDTQTNYSFQDESVNNKDLRVIKNNNRQTILLYSFVDKNTIIVTTNENIFNVLLNRYLVNKMAN